MNKKDNLWKNMKRIWQYVKKEKGNMIIYIMIAIMECVVSAIIPLISAKIILDITNSLFKQLLLSAFTILIIELTLYGVFYIKGIVFQKISIRVVNLLQQEVAREMLKLEIKEIDAVSSGVFIDRLNHDTKEISSIFMDLAYWLSYIISNIGVLVAIFFLNRYFFLLSIFTAGVGFIINKIRLNKQYQAKKELRKLEEEKTGLTSELVRGIRDIKVLNADKIILEQFSKRIDSTAKEEKKMLKIKRKYLFFENATNAVNGFLFLGLGCFLCSKKLLAIPNFIILYNYQHRIEYLMQGVTQISEYLKQFAVASNRVFEIICGQTFEKEKFGSKHLAKITGKIEFCNVTFGYSEKENILESMNFKVYANETTAFVGRSGAGKSTIFNLLTRLYHPTRGTIFLDDIDINELDQSSIRNNMSIITQNPYIFNFSIKENLLLAKPNASMKEIKEACQIACLDEFIMSLKDQYETIVGEGGISLSGGQRQRLAIARALLMKTEIILFDEATSALDNKTQSEIQQAIHNMQGKYTILIIAHRLSTVIDSDRIFVVDQGKILANGSHLELLESCPFYRSLYEKDLIPSSLEKDTIT